jgi:mersacidin/lichenicidin family type 2 lantibiotic
MQFDIIRAWKNESYRQSLSHEQLPANPAGTLELADADLETVSGGYGYGGQEFGGQEFGEFGYNGNKENFHSFAAVCDITAFSANTIGNRGDSFLSPNICLVL